jgi:Holliday junction resolvasome RuvABC endonuclease subunit
MNLLALDPSFTATGWCIIDLAAGRPVAMGVIRNPVLKDERAKRATAAENDAMRGTIIRHAVTALVSRFQPAIAVLEGDAGSQHAKAAKGLSRAQQACVDALDAVGFPLFVTPQAVKKCAVGRLSATEEEMRRAMEARWFEGQQLPYELDVLLEARPPYAQKPAPPGEWHNAIDALAVAACVWELPAVASLRRTLLPDVRVERVG